MSDVFGAAYSAVYDVFYASKDYASECDAIERAFAQFAVGQVRTVHDLGCGTGGHAIPLAARGYKVVGVDRAPEMLATARGKSVTAGVARRVSFVQGDVTAASNARHCDAALMMFNVLGYQASPPEMAAALAAVRRSLLPGGLFLFDVWDADAVEVRPPEPKRQLVEHGDRRFIRLSSGEIDRTAGICTVTVRLQRLAGDWVTAETVEHHRLRYFTRRSLARALECADLELLRWGSFPHYWREPDGQQWSVFGVARAAG